MYKTKNLIKSLIFVLTLGFTSVNAQSPDKATLCFPNGNPCLTVDYDLDGNDACCDNMDLAPGVTCTDDCPLLAMVDPLGGDHPTSQPSHFSVGEGDDIEVWIYKDGALSEATFEETSIEYFMINMAEEKGVFTFLSDNEAAVIGFEEPTDDPEYDPDNELYQDLYDGGTYAFVRVTPNTSRKKSSTDLAPGNSNFNVFPNPAPKGRKLTLTNEQSFSMVRLLNIQGKTIENINFNNVSEGKVEVTLPNSLSPGVYFIEVLGKDNQKKVEKLFVN